MAERILVVDDEPGVRTALEAILGDEGFSVSSVGSGEECVERLSASAVDAVLLDVWLPGIDGLETLTRLRDRRVDAEVVMISGHATIETAVKATRLGAFDFVEKPLSLEKTLLVVRNALRQRRLERRNRRLLEQLTRDTEIVGDGPAARRLREDVVAASRSDAPVLLVGERGSGREAVARRIHAGSRRAQEGFVVVPCAALDAAGAEAAVFGTPSRPSRLSLAEGGTAYLEDVERLPAEVQERLGAAIERGAPDLAEVRPVASTTSPGADLVDPLRVRLEVIRIAVPALRERREDVPAIAERMAEELGREYGRPDKRLAAETLAVLASADWPGNLRELRNVIEGAILRAPGEVVAPEHLPERLGGTAPPLEDLYAEFPSLAAGVAAFERSYVRRALAATKGDRSAAARALGLSASALDAKLAELGLA